MRSPASSSRCACSSNCAETDWYRSTVVMLIEILAVGRLRVSRAPGSLKEKEGEKTGGLAQPHVYRPVG